MKLKLITTDDSTQNSMAQPHSLEISSSVERKLRKSKKLLHRSQRKLEKNKREVNRLRREVSSLKDELAHAKAAHEACAAKAKDLDRQITETMRGKDGFISLEYLGSKKEEK
ncbi:MAG: hypothetical protein ACI4PV_02200 [Butyricicoccus sp.]